MSVFDGIRSLFSHGREKRAKRVGGGAMPTRAFKIQIGKDEKRAKGRRGVLFRSPKENQKGRYNAGGHRIASGPAAESGQPGCKASGESRDHPQGKARFPLGISPAFSGPEAPNFRNPSVTRDDSLGLSIKQLCEEWVQGIIPWRGVQGPRRPLPRPPVLLSLFANCVLY